MKCDPWSVMSCRGIPKRVMMMMMMMMMMKMLMLKNVADAD